MREPTTFTVLLLIILSSFTLNSCLDFGGEGEYHKDSENAKQATQNTLGLSKEEEIANPQFYYDESGIDPSYAMKFETSGPTIDSLVVRFKLYETDMPAECSRDIDWYIPSKTNSISYSNEEMITSPIVHLTYDTISKVTYVQLIYW